MLSIAEPELRLRQPPLCETSPNCAMPPAMADFSHLAVITDDMVARYELRGGKASDEMLLEAFERIDPPLVDGNEYRFVAQVLARKPGRRYEITGSASDLAGRMRAIRRNDVHPAFVDTLARRLESDVAYSEFDRGWGLHKLLEKRKRENLIRGLYISLRDMQDGKDHIAHPILGRIAVPQGVSARSDRALIMTQTVLRERLGYAPPSVGRIRNIVSGR